MKSDSQLHSRRGVMRTIANAVALSAAASVAARAAEPPAVRRPARSTARLIDMHAHAILPIWVEAARKASNLSSEQQRISASGGPLWSVEKHLEMMDRHGIAAAVLSWPSATSLFSGAEARRFARAMNEAFAEIIARHPTRFGAFAVLPLDDMEASVEELAYAMDVLKLDGASSSTHVQGAYLGHARYEPLFAELDRRGATLFVHPTTPLGLSYVDIGANPSMLEFMFDSTRMTTNMVLSGAKARYPRMRVISTHGGGTTPYLVGRVGILGAQYGAGPGRPHLSPAQIAEGFGSFYYDLTASTGAAALDAMRRLVPASQLMMGFDFPLMTQTEVEPSKARIAAYPGFSAADRRQIMDGTALKLAPQLASRLL